MHLFLSFNREILPHSAVFLPVVSSAAFYGRGVFTTLAVYRGKPFLWDSHEKRLRTNAAQIGVDVGEIDFANVESDLFELVKINSVIDGRARLTLFDSRSSPLWHSETNRKTDILITTAEHHKQTKNDLHLTISPFRVNSTSPLAGVKSCNYLDNILALETARANGYSEAVRLNERSEIVSATMANIFWTRDEQIFTPQLSTGTIAGTTREFIINLTNKLNFSVLETTSPIEDLETAEEIFLTSAGLGVCSVKSLDSRVLSDQITVKIQMAFAEIINV